MPIKSAEDAKADIGHHFPGLIRLGREVHSFVMQELRAVAPMLEARSKASIYRDIFVRKLRDYCDSTTGAHLHRKSQLVLVGLESKYALRVKRLSAGFSVGVSPTYASAQYDANKMPEYAASMFPDAPEATLLYLGWSVPENAPTAMNLYLVCNDSSRKVLWAVPLSDGDEGRGIQQPLPYDGEDEDAPVRILVKSGSRKANG